MAAIRGTRVLSIVLSGVLLAAMVPSAAAGESGSAGPARSAGIAASGPPSTSLGSIELEPIIDLGYGISSVAPVGWTEMGNGIRARARSPEDPTLIALQSAPMGLDAIWPTLLQQLGLSAIPQPVETRRSAAGFDWSLYQTAPIPGLVADLGVAEREGVSYVAMLLATSEEASALRDSVFLPAVDAFALAVRPAATANPSWTEVDVTFPGGATGVTLAGTLTIPTSPGPHPAVVLMSGSGPQDRDERLPGIDFGIFAVLADALAQSGVAVLRYDDRGTARSTGSYAGALVADFTADGAASLRFLRTRPEVDAARTGVLGHSEGGMYVASIAASDPSVAFVVGLAPAVGTGFEIIVDQSEAILRADGASDEALSLTRASTPAIYRAALDGDLGLAEKLAREWFDGLYDLSSVEDRALMGDRSSWVDAQVAALMATVGTEEFRSFLRTDPTADWRRVRSPTLGVFGAKDVQVVADAEAPKLEAALAAAGNTRSRVVVLDGANHMFQVAGTGAVSEYGSLAAAFTPALLPLVTGWIAEVTGLNAEGSPGPP